MAFIGAALLHTRFVSDFFAIKPPYFKQSPGISDSIN